VNSEREKPPLFIDVATFGAGAEACAAHLTKGRAVAVTGRLAYREWQAKDGSKRSKHEVIGRVTFGAWGASGCSSIYRANRGGVKNRDAPWTLARCRIARPIDSVIRLYLSSIPFRFTTRLQAR
jgi:single-stranded DNA-binding protein